MVASSCLPLLLEPDWLDLLDDEPLLLLFPLPLLELDELARSLLELEEVASLACWGGGTKSAGGNNCWAGTDCVGGGERLLGGESPT